VLLKQTTYMGSVTVTGVKIQDIFAFIASKSHGRLASYTDKQTTDNGLI